MSAADDLTLSVRILAGLIKDVTYLAEGNENTKQSNIISLGAEIVHGIVSAKKNGSTITNPTNYTHAEYRPNVTLVANPAANDIFYFRVKVGLSDTDIDEHLDRAKDDVLSKLRGFYDSAEAIDTKPTFLEIVRDLTAGRLIQLRSAGVALESAQYRTGRQMELDAWQKVKDIQQGKAEILKTDNTAVDRKANALMGGTRHSDGAIAERGDWWTRLRSYDGAILRPVGQTDPDDV